MTAPYPVRILYAGGCHIVGYPVGPEHAFPLVVARQLEASGIASESHLLPYVALHQFKKAIEACGRFRPDILVLQLGNYELGSELGQYLLSRLGCKRKRKSSSSSAGGPIANRPRYSTRARVKQWIDQCLGHPLVDFPVVSARFEEFLAATAHSGCQVVLTTPTPCADATARYYRLRALPILEAAAARHNCLYVDLMALGCAVKQQSLGRDLFFADAIHLGIAGQAAVGQALAVHIRKVVQSAAIQA